MKFLCDQPVLAKALNTVSKAVTSRTTIPILKGILLEVTDEGILKISASDLDLSIEKKIKVSDSEKGSLVVPAKLFGDIIRKLPIGNIEINSEENELFIKSGASEFKINCFSSDEFPKIPVEEGNEKIVFNKEILKNMIDKTAFSASIDENRGIITGILIELKENKLNMVSLDGFRMAVARESMKNGKEKNIVIPAKILSEVSKIISENDENEAEDVLFFINNKKAVFVIGNVVVVVSLLDGDFVKYNDILPKESKIKVIVNKQDLLNSIERASLLARIGKNNLIKCEIMDNNLIITSKSEEGNVREEVLISKEGENLQIGFNTKYLIEALKVIEDDEIQLNFNTPITPCLIKPISGDSFEYLVLPVRLSNN